MRLSVVMAVALLVPLLAGCAGDEGPSKSYDTPAAGRDAAFAAAMRHDPTARLAFLMGVEPTQGSPRDEDGKPWGFEAPMWDDADPAIDGRADAWLWTFNGTAGPWDVLTSGSQVLGQRETPADVAAELGGPILDEPGSSSTVDYDTAAMVRRIADHDPDWVDGVGNADGTMWFLGAFTDGPRWMVVGFDPVDGGELWYEFDGQTGELVNLPTFNGPPEDPDLTLQDCTNFGGVFPVPMADATAALPAGFQPVPSASDPTGGATLYILALDCAGSTVEGNDTGPVKLSYAELAVVPPDEFKLPGITDYTVPLAFGATVDAVGDRLAQFMLGHAGPSTVSDVTDGSPGPRKARMVVDGVTLDLTGQFAGESSTLRDGAFALIGVQDGQVHTLVQGFSEGGSAVQGTVTQQSSGLPILAQARPLAVGFSVSGFTLSFALAKTV